MKILKIFYTIFMLYPYWLIRNMIKLIIKICKTIFSYQTNEKLIDEMSGYEFECFIKQLLIKLHYQDVQMTKNSGDYGIDIIACKDHLTYGFQCKRYRKNIGIDAIQQVKAGKEYYELDEAVVITNSYFTSAAYNLASHIDVELIDRVQLFKLMKKTKMMISSIPWYFYFISFSLSLFFIYLTISEYQNIYFFMMILSLCLNLYMIIKALKIKKYYQNNVYTIHEYKS